MSTPTPAIVVVGSYNHDCVFRCEQFPQPGETIVGHFKAGPGGKGSNQAVAAARTGTSTAFIGAVGEDAFGVEALRFLSSEGIDTRLRRIADAPTGTAGIIVDAQGENEIIVALGANTHVPLSSIDPGLIGSATVLVTQHEINRDATASALERARDQGTLAILNPAPMPPDFDPAVLRHVDILVPNETEFAALVRLCQGERYDDFAGEMLHALGDNDLHGLCRGLGVPAVVITLGKRGSFVSTADGHTLIPALGGVQPVDTVGAGDAFVGGLASGLVRFDRDLLTAARYASVVAGLAVTRRGAALAMPKADEIEARWTAEQGG